MSSIWIPYIIFRNTDNDDAVDIEKTRAAVSIKKQGDFVRSGLDVANEVVMYTELFLFFDTVCRLRYLTERRIL